jgi:hypothetical protein
MLVKDPNIATINLCAPTFANASFLQVLAFARSAWQPKIFFSSTYNVGKSTMLEKKAQISLVSIPKRLMWWDTHHGQKCMLACSWWKLSRTSLNIVQTA